LNPFPIPAPNKELRIPITAFGCDYLFQIKDNQPSILEAAKVCFAEVDPENPDHKTVEKKTAMSKHEVFGATKSMPSMFENV
jgi:hypothetical protein